MLEEEKFYIKLAVDIERRILAGGGEMHYFCEQALLEDGSSQKISGEQVLCLLLKKSAMIH
ncbi:asl7356 (plasmid) [Nostoc sp. PCC 7120 = FACHB-418]|nr:asl7356 [Nostoc sp. PCC 7120 = FACHB-418]